jgi:DNA-directed RNA polymerase sigma subunit (sigma70/sigma32)
VEQAARARFRFRGLDAEPEISIELEISKERVRQIREAAEKKLRVDFIVLALWQSFLNRR